MKTSLDHLPLPKQRELDHIINILFEEFEAAQAAKTSPKKKGGRILKIILFGSFARGDWVEDFKSGYKSDFDLLIIVSAKYLCDFEYWEKAEERFLFHPNIRRTVQLVVEPLSHVNKMLSERQYFFSDIRDEGIALYEANSRKALPQAKPLNEAEFTALSQKHFEIAFPSAKEIFETAHLQIEKGMNKWAAFSLHQATEHAYNAFLLVHTHYSPSTHNIRKLRGFSEDLDKTLVTIWPRNNRIARRRFELLRRAYVEARYSEHYEISREDLDWLTDRVTHLHKAIEKVCKKRLKR